MSNNILDKETFLKKHVTDSFSKEQLQADASFRVYERLKLKDKTLILMDSSAEKDSVSSFIKVGEYLAKKNYSAPKIIAKDESSGFLLLEDLGDNTYTKMLAKESPERSEHDLYKNAVDVLLSLHKLDDVIELKNYNNQLLLDEVLLLVDHYLKPLGGCELSKELREEYIQAWTKILNCINYKNSCLVLRDYHVDNLMWLGDRRSIQNVGLLDFQDAVIGSYAYDLVSLLEDARRDVSPDVVLKMMSYYLDNMAMVERKKFLSDYTILSAQRSCKIVGIFARKAIRDNDSRFLQHLPRVWSYIRNNMNNPILEPIKNWFAKVDLPIIRDRSQA